jgi:indolepyruvate ferredoxin oxidoreductase beta subunit
MSYSILIVGVGGQGVLLASRVLGECAMRSGHKIALSEVHGMAQRGGSVTALVRFGEEVISPLIPKGGADLIVGFEPVETYRALPYANQNTLIVTDVRPLVPMTVTSGKESYPEVDLLLASMRGAGLQVLPVEATRLAEEAGARVTVNSVLIGAISALGSLPLEAELLHSTLMSSVPPKAKGVNQRAYELGRDAVQGMRT